MIVDSEPINDDINILKIFVFLFNKVDTPIKRIKSIRKLKIIIKSIYITIYSHLLDCNIY